jgi:hypothetical protein
MENDIQIQINFTHFNRDQVIRLDRWLRRGMARNLPWLLHVLSAERSSPPLSFWDSLSIAGLPQDLKAGPRLAGKPSHWFRIPRSDKCLAAGRKMFSQALSSQEDVMLLGKVDHGKARVILCH